MALRGDEAIISAPHHYGGSIGDNVRPPGKVLRWNIDSFETALPYSCVINEYCVAKPSSSGCLAEISLFPGGNPISGDYSHVARADNVQKDRVGLLVGSHSGSADISFAGGTLCVQPPLERDIGLLRWHLRPDCSGQFSANINQGDIFPSGLDPGHGQTAWYQFWYRDSANGVGNLGTALSNALEVHFQ